MSLMIA